MFRYFTRHLHRLSIVSVAVLTLSFVAQASTKDSVAKADEMRIYSLSAKINLRNSEQQNSLYNDTIVSLVEEIVQKEYIREHKFDSLKNMMSILDAPDKSFRIINWAYPLKNGTFKYYAYIIRSNADKGNEVFALYDDSDSIENPLKQTLNKNSWYGCLYYELLHNVHNKRDIYTLLGWDGQDLFTNQKIVDVLTFSSAGQPILGKNIFTGPFAKYKRVMLQYSEKSSMTLNYNREKGMIIFDHLSPAKPSYTGHYEYYGADFSYDGFIFENGKWKYTSDVDIRLEKPKKKKTKQ